MSELQRRDERMVDTEIIDAAEQYMTYLYGSRTATTPAQERVRGEFVRWIRFRKVIESERNPEILGPEDYDAESAIFAACINAARRRVSRGGNLTGDALIDAAASLALEHVRTVKEFAEKERVEEVRQGVNCYSLAGRMVRSDTGEQARSYFDPTVGNGKLSTWIGQEWMLRYTQKRMPDDFNDAWRISMLVSGTNEDGEEVPFDPMDEHPLSDPADVLLGTVDLGGDADAAPETSSTSGAWTALVTGVDQDALIALLNDAGDFALRECYVSFREQAGVVSELLESTPGHSRYGESFMRDLGATGAHLTDQSEPHAAPCQLSGEAVKSRYLAAQARYLLAARHCAVAPDASDGMNAHGTAASTRGWLSENQSRALTDGFDGFLASRTARRHCLLDGQPTFGVRAHVHYGVCNLLIAIYVDTRTMDKHCKRIAESVDGAREVTRRFTTGQMRTDHAPRVVRTTELLGSRKWDSEWPVDGHAPEVVFGPEGLDLKPKPEKPDTTRKKNVLELEGLMDLFADVADLGTFFQSRSRAAYLPDAVEALVALKTPANCKAYLRNLSDNGALIGLWTDQRTDLEWHRLITAASGGTTELAWQLTTRYYAKQPRDAHGEPMLDCFRDAGPVLSVMADAWSKGVVLPPPPKKRRPSQVEPGGGLSE